MRIGLVSSFCLYDLCASSYGHFIAALEFRSQCRICILWSLVDLRPKGRSEANKSCFFRLGLKPMPEDASRRELSKSVLRIEKGALCAELRPFYCSIRILVPMSYMFPHVHSMFPECSRMFPDPRRVFETLIIKIAYGNKWHAATCS